MCEEYAALTCLRRGANAGEGERAAGDRGRLGEKARCVSASESLGLADVLWSGVSSSDVDDAEEFGERDGCMRVGVARESWGSNRRSSSAVLSTTTGSNGVGFDFKCVCMGTVRGTTIFVDN